MRKPAASRYPRLAFGAAAVHWRCPPSAENVAYCSGPRQGRCRHRREVAAIALTTADRPAIARCRSRRQRAAALSCRDATGCRLCPPTASLKANVPVRDPLVRLLLHACLRGRRSVRDAFGAADGGAIVSAFAERPRLRSVITGALRGAWARFIHRPNGSLIDRTSEGKRGSSRLCWSRGSQLRPNKPWSRGLHDEVRLGHVSVRAYCVARTDLRVTPGGGVRPCRIVTGTLEGCRFRPCTCRQVS